MFDIFKDNKFNGLDMMIMQSNEDAEKIIKEVKKIIDIYGNGATIEYDDSNLIESDKKRVKQELITYLKYHGKGVNIKNLD